MVDAGLELVRLGEFAWGTLERAPGAIDSDRLARAVDTAGAAGLDVVLGTPTAAPPRWLVRMRPDIQLMDVDRSRRAAGSRRATCPTAPAFREA